MAPRSSVKLRVVTGARVHDPRTPEDLLGFLFAREATLAAELADVRLGIAEQRKRYALKHRLGAHPRVELLRARYGPQEERR